MLITSGYLLTTGVGQLVSVCTMPSGRQRLYDLVMGSILAVGRLVSSFSKVFCSRLREYGGDSF